MAKSYSRIRKASSLNASAATLSNGLTMVVAQLWPGCGFGLGRERKRARWPSPIFTLSKTETQRAGEDVDRVYVLVLHLNTQALGKVETHAPANAEFP